MVGVRFKLALGITGHAANRFLTVWLIADLMADAVFACQARDVAFLSIAVLNKLPLLFAIMIINGFSTWFCGMATSFAAQNMRKKLFSTTMDSSLEAVVGMHSGKMLSYYANDIPTAAQALVPALTQPLGAFFMGLGGLFYVLWVRPVMAVIVTGIGILTFVYGVLFADKLHTIAGKIQSLLADLEVRLRDLLDGMVTVRMFSLREKLEIDMNRISQELSDTGIRWARVSALLGGINNFVSTMTDQVLVFAAGILFLGGSLSVPELLRISQVAGGIIGVFHVSRLLVSVQKSLAGAERVFEYLDSAVMEKTGGESVDTPEGSLSFEHVEFRYAGVLPILKDVSFSAGKGELIALLGPSGSGKSTALRLIQGLVYPYTGTVKICGMSTGDWDREALRTLVSLVPQEIVLFPETIAGNIAIGLRDISLSQIEAAAKRAGAHEFIVEMPQGYQTPVSERGLSLSGGQRQRIAIARALLRDAPILLLDEITSAMDPKSEQRIYDTLRSLKGDKTILFVTHRVSALEIADRVVTL